MLKYDDTNSSSSSNSENTELFKINLMKKKLQQIRMKT
ncbi:hypothetical protein Godav_029405 [Gossypium davidsonii]|uniref:Uncharacterized protein n=1 Tax=Gossypium davidsonii TaxID=34287 RepID=A0A7J8T9E4_GOSDV|nr:hypothetical protein [Gossypium davidsonii]